MPKSAAWIGAGIVAVSCVLGVIALVTSSWSVRRAFLVKDGNGNASSVVWTKGLWEQCEVPVTASGHVPCTMKPLTDGLDTILWVLRILILVSDVLTLITFIVAVIWLINDRCKNSYCWRTLVFVLSSFAAFITMMPVVGYLVMVISAVDSAFTVGWSLGIALAGGALLAPGNFFLCLHAHRLDDEDNLLREKHNSAHREMGEFPLGRDIAVTSSYM